MAIGAILNPLGSILGAGVNLFNGIQQRNAAKRAATQVANAATEGTRVIGDANTLGQNWGWEGANKAIDAYGGQAAAAQERIAQAGQAATQGVAQGTVDANTRLQQILNTGKDVYDTEMSAVRGAQGMLSPYQSAGQTGATRLQDLLMNPQSALENTPGYQFQLQQGLKGVQQGAAAGGALQSGGTLKALTQFGQGLASTTYQDAIKNALAASGIGLDASQQNLAAVGLGQASGREYMGTNRDVGGTQASNILKNAVYGGETGKDVAAAQSTIGTDFGKYSGNIITDTYQNAAEREARKAAQIADLGMIGAGAAGSGALAASNAMSRGIAGATAPVLDLFSKGNALADIFKRKPNTTDPSKPNFQWDS